jgi:hypothetical protein
MVIGCVLFEVRTHYLNIIKTIFGFRGLKTDGNAEEKTERRKEGVKEREKLRNEKPIEKMKESRRKLTISKTSAYERDGQVVSTPPSNSRLPGFKPRPGDRLS